MVMTAPSSYVAPELVREGVRADFDLIGAAYERVCGSSTDLVGNAFRLEMAERLEALERINRGLSYRMFGEIADPPDGPDAGVRVRDQLATRLRITAGEVRRRMRLAVRIRPRRSLTGPSRPPELPILAEAVEHGALGEDHIYEVCRALDRLPRAVCDHDRSEAERILVEHARTEDSLFVSALGRGLADVYNPDGLFDEQDRQNRRGLTLGRQGPDGMSRLTGWLTPKARAYFETIAAAVRPGHHLPGAEQAVVGANTDVRSEPQRLHDALELAMDTAIGSGQLGQHRGLPVTVIVTTTVAALEQAAQAVADPGAPMPPPARTGGGSALPMRDLIAMAARATHYLAVFDNHSARPLYLGRAQRLASADQRIICYARDRGCTHCAQPGYHCEVHHALDYASGGSTDADNLFFACGPANRAAADGTYQSTVTESGRLAWTNGSDPPKVNPIHHPEELLGGDDDR